MNTVELFSGTKSFSKVAELLGHRTLTIDNDDDLVPDICIDVLEENPLNYLTKRIDVLWASPPCQGFSVASIGKMWNRDNTPKHPTAVKGLELLEKTIEVIQQTQPKYWFIENPRGKMRKMDILKDFRRVTVTYCQYGDTRMKPTDIWTNLESWKPKPPCKNGMNCHVSAPRGSRTPGSTQGTKGAKGRGRIPPALFYEIFEAIKNERQD